MPNKARKSCPKLGGRIWGKLGVSEVTLGVESSNCENKPTHSPKLRLECKKLLLVLALSVWHSFCPPSPVILPPSWSPSCPPDSQPWYSCQLELRFWDGGEGHTFWIPCPWSGTDFHPVCPFPVGEYRSQWVGDVWVIFREEALQESLRTQGEEEAMVEEKAM